MAPAQWQTQSAGATSRSLGRVKIAHKKASHFLILNIKVKHTNIYVCTILLKFLHVVMVRWWIWDIVAGIDHSVCWLTYVTVETWSDIEGDGKREVAGGCVKAGLHVTPMSSHNDCLSTAPLKLWLDLFLTLKTHWILSRTCKNSSYFQKTKHWLFKKKKQNPKNLPASMECLLLRSWMYQWCPHQVCTWSWRCRTLPLYHACWWC